MIIPENEYEYCVANKGIHYTQLRDADEFTWDELYPEINIYGYLTGNVLDANSYESDNYVVIDDEAAMKKSDFEKVKHRYVILEDGRAVSTEKTYDL